MKEGSSCVLADELFWKSISDSMQHHYRQLLKHTISWLWLFCLLGIFLWGESQNTTWNRKSREGEVSLMEKAGMWYFKSHFYASAEMTWSPSISNHVLFVAGHILDLVEYYAAWIRLFLVCCNQSPTEENQIWQVWNRGIPGAWEFSHRQNQTFTEAHRIQNKPCGYP